MIPTVVTSKAEMVAVIRRRRDELGITHATVDAIAGWADGYCSKVLCDPPMKGFGEMSLGLVLGALALGIARVEIVEDPAQAERVSSRWVKRKRPFYALERAVLASALSTENSDTRMKERMRMLGSMGGKKGGSKGGKRRAKLMHKQARQRAASHAARVRWARKSA